LNEEEKSLRKKEKLGKKKNKK